MNAEYQKKITELIDQIASGGEDYRRLVERLPAIVYASELGEGGHWRYVSPQVEEILGYPVEQTVRIDNIKDLGEWKTAWDHISFEGFLGVRMKLQFTWEGCDSALAAPLVLDLARLASLALGRGEYSRERILHAAMGGESRAS